MKHFIFSLWPIVAVLVSGCHFSKSLSVNDFPAVCSQKIGQKFNEQNCTLRKGYLEHEYVVCEECKNVMIWLNSEDIVNTLMINRLANEDYEQWKKQLKVYFDSEPDGYSADENSYLETWKSDEIRCVLISNRSEESHILNVYYH